MANRNDKHPENVPGKWYVDTSCIICGLCSEYASAVFKVAEDGTQNVVYHQPETPAELKSAEDAMSDCPMDCIGNDGEPTEIVSAGNTTLNVGSSQ